MHEFRRFIQKQLDDQGLRQADLVTRSGLTRSHVSKLMRDSRDHLGQMPDKETLEALATGFGVPVERVRIAAARSLIGYADDGAPIDLALGDIPTDALLSELKRRIESAPRTGVDNEEDTQQRQSPPSTLDRSAGSGATGRTPSMTTGKARALIDADQGAQLDYDLAQRRGETQREYELRTQVQPEDESQDDGSDGGA